MSARLLYVLAGNTMKLITYHTISFSLLSSSLSFTVTPPSHRESVGGAAPAEKRVREYKDMEHDNEGPVQASVALNTIGLTAEGQCRQPDSLEPPSSVFLLFFPLLGGEMAERRARRQFSEVLPLLLTCFRSLVDLYDKDKVDIEHVSMEDVFVLLQCDDKGLTEEEAVRRIGIFGPNKVRYRRLVHSRSFPAWRVEWRFPSRA